MAGSDYLALGDSVAFGYREDNTSPPPNYYDAKSFVGYPEIVASDLGLKLANLACPGETSGSLINPNAPSNGCENHPNPTGGPVSGGYRTVFPLHVRYAGSQLSAADAYVKAHRHTRLVTLMTGANDFFLCQETTKDRCTAGSERRAVLSRLEAHLATILRSLRRTGYRGQIMLVGYYSLDYADPHDDGVSKALNAAMRRIVAKFHVEYANGLTAWARASRLSHGNSCRAGLLTQLYRHGRPTATCGIHPAPPGAAVLASAIDKAVIK